MSDKAKLFTLSHKPIEIEGGNFTARQLKSSERNQIISLGEKATPDERSSLLISLFLGDENGNRIFADPKAPEINDISSVIQDKIIEAGNSVNFPDAQKKS